MPHRVWKHWCPKHGENGGEIVFAAEKCRDCGQVGVFDGWDLSTIEQWGARQRLTGLKPFGPHGALVSEMLGPMIRTCEICHGRGLIDIGLGREWWHCPSCNCARAYLDGTAEQIAAIRQRILEAFPDAALD